MNENRQQLQTYICENGRRSVSSEHYLGIGRYKTEGQTPTRTTEETTPSSTMRPAQQNLKDAVVLR